MPRYIPQVLEIFPTDVTSTTRVDNGITLDRALDPPIQNLVHTTRMPGGFGRLQFNLPMTQAEYWEWRLKRLDNRLRIDESGGHVIWEGRLEKVKLLDFWTVQLSAYGYYRNFDDGIDNVDHNAAGGTIVQNLRDLLHADTDQLNTSNDDITATTATLQLKRNGLDKSAWETITDPVAGLLTYGDTSGNAVDLAVWEDRKIHYKARNPSALDWRASYAIGDVSRYPDEIDLADIWNAVDVRYDLVGTPTLVGFTTDAASITKYHRRERIVGHSTRVGDATTATALRDLELALRKDDQQRMDTMVLKGVSDANGVRMPLCRVRAGEVIRVTDIIPQSADLDAVTLNALTTYFIRETVCDHQRGQLTIVPDTERRAISRILARNNIR